MNFDETKRKSYKVPTAAHTTTAAHFGQQLIPKVWLAIYEQIDIQIKSQFYWGMRRNITGRGFSEL